MTQYSKLRTEWIDESRTELLNFAKSYQKAMLNAILEQWGPGLQLKDGKFIFSVGNIGKVTELEKLLKSIAGLEGEKLLKWFLNQTQKNALLNLKYFNVIVPDKAPLAQKSYTTALEKILMSFGYDGKQFSKNGVLFDLAMTGDPIRKIKAEAIRAISAGQSFKDYLKKMDIFIKGDPKKEGVIESHFRTNAYDTFQQVDRQIGNQMADALELNNAVYSGTIMETTRAFCKDKVGKVFTRQEILAWSKQDWQGKPSEGYDPIRDVGGYNCTHQLDWISDSMAKSWK
jgi:hypothetical protein